jgi:3-oxoadipate enol-lactonase
MHVDVRGIATHYELDGPANAPVVIFSHSLGAALGMWDPQVAPFAQRYRALRYDVRGHGQSAAPPGPYSLDDLVDDVRGLLDALEIERAWFVGLSMGGMIAQLMALRHPERLHGAVFCDTFSDFPEVAHAAWDERIRTTLEQGMEPQVEPAMQRWFTPAFRDQRAEVVNRIRELVRSTNPLGYVACSEAVRGLSLGHRLHEIEMAALIVAGTEDPGVPPELARAMHERIAGSELALIERASHLCNVEQAEAFNRLLLDFLDRATARAR